MIIEDVNSFNIKNVNQVSGAFNWCQNKINEVVKEKEESINNIINSHCEKQKIQEEKGSLFGVPFHKIEEDVNGLGKNIKGLFNWFTNEVVKFDEQVSSLLKDDKEKVSLQKNETENKIFKKESPQELIHEKTSCEIELSSEDIQKLETLIKTSNTDIEKFEMKMTKAQEKIEKLQKEVDNAEKALKSNSLDLNLKKEYLKKIIELKYSHGEYVLIYANKLSELVEKAKVLKKVDVNIDISEIERISQAATDLYEEIGKEKKQQQIELDNLTDETWSDFFKEFTEIFENTKSLDEQTKLDSTLIQLLSKIEGKKTINESELEIFKKLLDNTSIFKDSSLLREKIIEFAIKHQKLIGVLAAVPAVGLATLLGGPFVGFATHMSVKQTLKNYLPESQAVNTGEKIVVGTIETLTTAVINPMAALSTVLANLVQGTTSENVQKGITAASVGLAVQQSGGSASMSMGTGFLAALYVFKPQMLSSIAEDLKHVWKNIREGKILTVAKDALFFMPRQVGQNAVGIKKALIEVNGKRDRTQVITRLAAIALTVGILAASFSTLPLVIAIFYLVNKAFEAEKYQGFASFGSKSFREYVARKINEGRDLQKILKEENLDYSKYIDRANELRKKKFL